MDEPFKIKDFGWKLFVDRLPIKDILVYRGISFPLETLKYSFCGIELENKDHPFFLCDVIKNMEEDSFLGW